MLFTALFLPPRLREATGDRAWFQAMLDAEAALARAESECGLIPPSAADAIAAHCMVDEFDVPAILEEARGMGNPAEPLVRALRRSVPDEAADYVHMGATSQDIVDTAAMLVTQRTLRIVEGDLAAAAAALAQLAMRYRDTPMAGRTLLQQAVPVTFGLTAAQWLAGIVRARAALRRLRGGTLAVQLGGAAGTLAPLGDSGPSVLHAFSCTLGLAEPALPWHTERTRLAEIAGALSLTAGALERIALDIILLSQTEVGEVAEAGAGRRGGSSTMPQKQNPVGAVLARACARTAQTQAEGLFRAMAQELERAAGAWQAEWPALSGALAATGGAAGGLREALDGLAVRPDRMQENLEMTGGLIMAERVATLLAERLGREQAHQYVRSLSERAVAEGRRLTDVLPDDATVRGVLSPGEIRQVMSPSEYLGSSGAFIDRALALYREQER
ncbi:MAG TPA: 3-carboxy-cis,cis-muconate cycloisomerase [Chloroflexota bacterium]|nr:3-carboxy-cis,cis-muconate cycloisomerase [Chloroflexota bacterium]